MFLRFAQSVRTFVLKNGRPVSQDDRRMAAPVEDQAVAAVTGKPAPAARKPRCEDCYFHQNMLCALQDKKPCPTFRLAHPDGLRPPQQLSFVFRQERRAEPFVFQPAHI
jgi:hypothetical protein